MGSGFVGPRPSGPLAPGGWIPGPGGWPGVQGSHPLPGQAEGMGPFPPAKDPLAFRVKAFLGQGANLHGGPTKVKGLGSGLEEGPRAKGPGPRGPYHPMKNVFFFTGMDGFARPSIVHQKRQESPESPKRRQEPPKGFKSLKGPLKEGGPQDLSVPAMKNANFEY